jgi:hypothetical protein
MSPQQIGIVTLAALAAFAPVRAQQVTPTAVTPDGRAFGTVLDENENPVAGALVMLGDGRSTETDSHGQFSFLRLRPGTHEIAAVTATCAIATGGFAVQSGADARLQLIVQRPATSETEGRRSRGTASKVMGHEALAALGNRSALEALRELAPNKFAVEGHRLAMVSRRGAVGNDIIEPLLVIDGMRVPGLVAESLRSLEAGDLARMEVHLGSTGGWEFQHGGAPAVIEITMGVTSGNPLENPAICLRRNGG